MIKVGIFFGGPSREREISFAGGRTVYDNLNKSVFEPIPIFVDSHRRFILLDWQYIYKGTIRDFYPPVSALPDSPNGFQIYVESLEKLTDAEVERMIREVGRPLTIGELPELIDLAFLALHGEFGEDGQLQGLLESLQIPYTGSGIRANTIGIDKHFTKKIMEAGGFACPKVESLSKDTWTQTDPKVIFEKTKQEIGSPIVIRPANQGSSIGVTILDADKGVEAFTEAVDLAFFRARISHQKWESLNSEQRVSYIRQLTDIREGLGFPMKVNGQIIYHPEHLLEWLNHHFAHQAETALLESFWSEQNVILESFLSGKEFSCIVIRQEDGTATALPPTEIIKGRELFDYRSKYLPGLSRKQTPIKLPDQQINAIRQECENLFVYLDFQTYARIDGFIEEDGTIFLNDPNTTSGMLPSSFFFHQAAEIGLNPSQFLTYILRISLQERIWHSNVYTPAYEALLHKMDAAIHSLKSGDDQKKKIAVLLGGYSYERHISVESGRNIFEKLASSEKYDPLPVFLREEPKGYSLYQIPINLLLKDNADDIRDKIGDFHHHPVVEEIKQVCRTLTEKYASADVVFEPRRLSFQDLAQMVDGVFIALHGRPGEDGEIQKQLQAVGLPYNGSNPKAAGLTINKYETLQLLKKHGFQVAQQRLIYKEDFIGHSTELLEEIEEAFGYPLVAKPVDDGCSSAVKVIRNREQMTAYFHLLFRESGEELLEERQTLSLHPKEEFPQKKVALLESLITAEGAKRFLEITGGLLTHYDGDQIRYEIFEPSEALSSGEVLSLEEKFLAGEGQNITPARFADNPDDYAYIAAQVKERLKEAAQILNVQGYARIDAFVRIMEDRSVETIIIEVNSLPGMTPATCIYHQAALNGYKPYNFIDQILEFGFHERAANSILE